MSLAPAPARSTYLYGIKTPTPDSPTYRITLYCTHSITLPQELEASRPAIQTFAASYFSSQTLVPSSLSVELIVPKIDLIEKYKTAYPPDQLTEVKLLETLVNLCALRLMDLFSDYDPPFAQLVNLSSDPDFLSSSRFFLKLPISRHCPLAKAAFWQRFPSRPQYFTFSDEDIEKSRRAAEAKQKALSEKPSNGMREEQ